MMLRIFEVTISTPSARGRAPPDRPVPLPRATNATPRAAQAATTAATWAADWGSTTKPGVLRCAVSPSHSYVRNSCGSVMTLALPQIPASSAASPVSANPVPAGRVPVTPVLAGPVPAGPAWIDPLVISPASLACQLPATAEAAGLTSLGGTASRRQLNAPVLTFHGFCSSETGQTITYR